MWQQKKYDKDREKDLISQGKGKLLSRLISQRNIPLEEVDSFLSSDYKKLSHSYTLNDCEKAVNLWCEIAKVKGEIATIGDYDADGIIGSVMIKELCNVFGLNCYSFLPSRIDHGYGLSKLSVRDFIEKCPSIPDLLFVIDCGTNSKEEIKMLYDYGIKRIIIIDHHVPSTESLALNADALISWHLSKDYKYEMCSCGEIFQFIRGIRWLTKKIDPKEFISYAAIGTVADVSPIIGDNRIIVRNGLTGYALNHVRASGLGALIRQSKIYGEGLIQHDVAFKIAPKINAVGRIFNPDIVFKLLIERDPDIANNTAEDIAEYNEERKKIQKQIEHEAVELARKYQNKNGILVFKDSWNIGVVGIVASKLVEIFNKPSIVIGKNGDIWKGSGRSIKGINLKEILDTCPNIFESYGGHSGAVGVTLKTQSLEEANNIFDEACEKYYSDNNISQESIRNYDAMLDIPLIIPQTSIMLKNNLYPYCDENNPEPIFMVPQATIIDVKIAEGVTWRLLTFFIARNGKRCPYPFKFFTKKHDTGLEGKVMDVFFSFPQNNDFNASRFSQFELFVSDIIDKEKS